jgi:hypothetical protein
MRSRREPKAIHSKTRERHGSVIRKRVFGENTYTALVPHLEFYERRSRLSDITPLLSPNPQPGRPQSQL